MDVDHQLNPIPERLYHYTNLESLALILTNRTIRLMLLTGVDDPQERRAIDVRNIGKFVFISCWTDDPEESIPMWNMYASLDAGVRISLPPMPFKRYSLTHEEYAKAVGMDPSHISSESGRCESFMDPHDLANGLVSPSYLTGEDVLTRVEYTDESCKLVPEIVSVDGDSLEVRTGLIGAYKNRYWAFQREWRYKMQIVPFNVLDMSSNPVDRFNEMIFHMVNGALPSPCPYYDLMLDENALRCIEVVPSPKMSAGNRELLNLLLEKHGLSFALQSSQLEGLL